MNEKYWHDEGLARVATDLIQACTEFDHLELFEIRYLLTTKEAPASAEGCKRIASMQKLPAKVSATAAGTSLRAQGPQDVNAMPRPIYVMCVEHNWWQHAEDRAREALVHHELSHIDLEGRIVPHSVAEHLSTVRRYGKWQPALEQLGKLFDMSAMEDPDAQE